MKFLLLTLFTLVVARLHACTIFVLTDTEHALFCNNEDWSVPRSRIWFVPGQSARFGCAYVGFDDNWAQGGLNTQGLGYDWVGGYNEKWTRGPKMKVVEGNPCELMLQTCATVAQAVAFFQSHWDGSFAESKILIADRSGASVIIGAHLGSLTIEREDRCRGFGYAHTVLENMLAENSEPTVANAAKIMKAARQTGAYATKYSNIYDLKSGDIFLVPDSKRDVMVRLNLAEELKKGGHFYEMPELDQELGKALMPLSQMSHFAMFQPMLGDWLLELPRDADNLPEYAEYRLALADNAAAVRIDSWFVKGAKRTPIDNGLFIWDPAQGKMRYFDSSTTSHGTFTRGTISRRGDNLLGEYQVSNFDGSVSPRRVLIGKEGADVLVVGSSTLSKGMWTKFNEVRFVRHHASNDP